MLEDRRAKLMDPKVSKSTTTKALPTKHFIKAKMQKWTMNITMRPTEGELFDVKEEYFRMSPFLFFIDGH